jgi:uncharacterized protein YeaC (DUF1315 family)
MAVTPELYYFLLIVVFLGAWGNGERLKRQWRLERAEVEGADADSEKRVCR